MKMYILYDNPYDEGDNVYGAFSTKEKADRAYEIFSLVSNHQLYVREMELDDLEKYFEIASSGYRLYSGEKFRQEWGDLSVHYGEWGAFTPSGLDIYFDGDRKTVVLERSNIVWAHIWAKSPQEASEIADKILKEKGEGYLEWLK